MNPVSTALNETAAIFRTQGGFNDKSVDAAFASVAAQLEKRATEIEACSQPVMEVAEPTKTEDKPKKEEKTEKTHAKPVRE